MKLLRMIVLSVFLLVAICILAIAGLVYFIDPNKMKPVIIEEVKKRTGYQLVIEDSLSWSFYPRLGVNVKHMTLSAPNQSSPLADLKDVRIATELTQLIHGSEKLQGDIYISDVTFANIHAQKAHIVLHWQDHVLTMQPIVASLYEGSLQGLAHGRDLSSKHPKWDFDVQFNKIQLQPLLTDLNGANAKLKLSGVGEVKLQASTQGQSKDQILKNLNGTGSYRINNGVVQGIDINYLIQSADAFLSKQPLSAPANIEQTAFEKFDGTLTIKNGIASTSLSLTSSAFATKGDGSIDLLNQKLDFQLQVTPVQTTKLKGTLPILVTGDLDSPSVRLDTVAIETIVAREQLQKAAQKIEKETQKLREKADKFLQNVLGQ